MYKKNSSFSPVDDRFDFHKTGTFRLAYPIEVPALALMFFAAVMGAFAVWLFVFYLPTCANTSAAMMNSIYLLIAEVVWWFICIFVTRLLMSGSEYRFDADEKRLIIRRGEKMAQKFVYSDVTWIFFKPIKFLWIWQRGYMINIGTTHGEYNFRYIYVNFRRTHQDITDTPFYILEERKTVKSADAQPRP